MPNFYWAEAVECLVYLMNRTTIATVHNKTPEEVYIDIVPDLSHLKVFGCEAVCHVLKHPRDKLEPKSKKCVFLGYGNPSDMGFCLWDCESKKILF